MTEEAQQTNVGPKTLPNLPGSLKLYLIAVPNFLGLPPLLGVPMEDQLLGPDGAKLIETAGRTCYDSFGKGRSSADYHNHIIDVGHGSVLAHAVYSFFISGVSRGLTHELVRHGVGTAISQRSTRYVDESHSPWIRHPLIEQYIDETGDQSMADAWDEVKAASQDAYRMIVVKLEAFLSKRTAGANARKQARGAARGILGNALETELVWSANVRALRWIISQRASDAADAEIRQLGMALFHLINFELPQYFTDFTVAAASDGIGETVSVDQAHV